MSIVESEERPFNLPNSKGLFRSCRIEKKKRGWGGIIEVLKYVFFKSTDEIIIELQY